MRYAALTLCALAVAASACAAPLEVVSYGDIIPWRDNNLASPAYRSSTGGWAETRVLWGDRSHAQGLRPYVKLNVAFSGESIAEENNLTYGLGAEVRPLAGLASLAGNPWLEWLTRSRFFAEQLWQSPLKDAKPDWNPRHDLVIGFDAWREYGAVDEAREGAGDRSWGELWIGAAYHTTDFYLDDYASIRTGLNAKAGAVVGHGDWPLMPYAVVDLNTTSAHPFHWQNRMWGGVGLRTERELSEECTIKLWAEQRWVMAYLRDHPRAADEVPDSDTLIGLTFQLNRY